MYSAGGVDGEGGVDLCLVFWLHEESNVACVDFLDMELEWG